MNKIVTWVLVFYAIERLLETFWQRRKVTGRIIERYTLPLLVSAHVLIYLTTVGTWIIGKRQVSNWLTVTGTMMVLLSIVGRNWAIRALGSYHSIHVEVREEHPLIEAGPYKFVRNPYYLSNLVEIVGLPLVAGSILGLMLAAGVYVPLLMLRLVIEEKALESKFGHRFVSYKEQAPKIIPKLF
jgi:protein-S-isoprenylcysteine O-methyltransferase Ste14